MRRSRQSTARLCWTSPVIRCCRVIGIFAVGRVRVAQRVRCTSQRIYDAVAMSSGAVRMHVFLVVRALEHWNDADQCKNTRAICEIAQLRCFGSHECCLKRCSVSFSMTETLGASADWYPIRHAREIIPRSQTIHLCVGILSLLGVTAAYVLVGPAAVNSVRFVRYCTRLHSRSTFRLVAASLSY
jgi:hypothetical protein